ncbi:MAG: methionine--tRNA ligase [Patescibacteria group bacterium]
MNKFYITTAIPYVNAKPHLGFALELIQADVIARYHRQKGEDVFFLTGTDENAFKNFLAAREQNIEVHKLIDQNAQSFKELRKVLDLSWDDFIRTTEKRHVEGTQKFWLACQKDIYKKKYSGIYCNGCEEFKMEKDLVMGHCPEHPDKPLERVEEENYFFRLSAYQQQIEALVESGTLKIIPETRRHEVLAFIKQGLEDFSISRLRQRAPDMGIPVPGDDKQTVYVWFDALTNYITALGYAEDSEKFKKYWQENKNITHVIGKGVSRFHAVYWPAMLLSAGLNLPQQVFVHGYITVEGKKISKSLGNIIDPAELIAKYGVDPVRYYLLREISSYEDGDFSVAKLENRYNGDLANGLGNLVARTVTLGERISPIKFDFSGDIELEIKKICNDFYGEYESAFKAIKLHEALAGIWNLISFTDKYINEKKPWEVKDKESSRKILANVGYLLGVVLNLVEPFLPATGEKIRKQIWFSDSSINFKKGDNLFPRLS